MLVMGPPSCRCASKKDMHQTNLSVGSRVVGNVRCHRWTNSNHTFVDVEPDSVPAVAEFDVVAAAFMN
jgi:hypothetical protein